MSGGDSTSDERPSEPTHHGTATKQTTKLRSVYDIFTIPPPLKRIFDQYPLVTYVENELPLRAPKRRDAHVLHIFTNESDARNGRPSFNPACLKWQTFLKIAGVSFNTVASTNHASPSGSLPFLLPSHGSTETASSSPIVTGKMRKWTTSQGGGGKIAESSDVRSDAYTALLENGIRKAWLYQLYISASNSPLVRRLYIAPSSSNFFVQTTIGYQLQRAAQQELTKSSASDTIEESTVMQEAASSCQALASLLGDDEWFFGQQSPGLFDASVFAYTHLILDSKMGWQDNKLEGMLMEHGNLVQHRYRMLEMYY